MTSSKALALYFEECVRLHPQPKTVSNWIMVELVRQLRQDSREKKIEACPVSAPHLAALLDLIQKGVISGKIAKTVFEVMYETGQAPQSIVEEKGLVQVTDTAAKIEAVAEEVLQANAEKVADYKGGKDKLFGFFVGEVMKRTKGKANPKDRQRIIEAEKLG